MISRPHPLNATVLAAVSCRKLPSLIVLTDQRPTSAHALLYATVAIAGLTSLGVELAASRLLDPWFGNSIFVWASLIALILLYLALGYWWGGRIADRYPRAHVLYTIVGIAALGVGLIPLISQPILRLAADVFVTYDAAILLGSFSATLLLFAPPVILLGMVSPFAIRLRIQDVTETGRWSGQLYGLSTLGSILGILITVLLLIPNLGTRRTFFTLALLLLSLAIVGLFRQARRRSILFALFWIILLILAIVPTSTIRADETTLFEQESPYNYIRVVRNGPETLLKLNEGAGIHSVYRPDMITADGIWDYFLLAPLFSPAPVRTDTIDSLLLIGLAAGTVPKLYTAAYEGVTIDGVELDPAIIAVGRRYFAMTEPNLNAVAQDGRYYLNHGAGLYDVIALDAYRPPYIPFHLTTVEFFTEVSDHLTPDGVVAINAARTATDFSLVNALTATLKEVFPSVFIIDEPTPGEDLANSLIVATMQPTTMADFRQNISELEDPLLVKVAQRTQTFVREAPGDGPILRDDQAPVEQIIHGIVLRYMLGP